MLNGVFNVGKDLETKFIEFGLLLVLKVCSKVIVHINIDFSDPPTTLYASYGVRIPALQCYDDSGVRSVPYYMLCT